MTSDGLVELTDPPSTGTFYLRQFDVYRLAFIGVVAQHCVLWPVTGGAKIGWGLVMILHATRETFFFLSAFVALYAQATRPRSIGRLWYRRLSQVVVPYLIWTAIYFVYTMIVSPQPFGPAMNTLWGDLWYGYYQLYFAVVLIQFYVLLPLLLWLVRISRRYHWWVLGVSAVLQLAMMTLSHYFTRSTGLFGHIRHYDLDLTQSRMVVGYQLYIVAGLLAADHVDDVQRFVARHHRRILAGCGIVGLLTVGYYIVGLALHQTPGHASDLYQPVAVVWFSAAIVALYTLGWIWARRAATRPATRLDRAITWGSDVSGGYYFSHVLVLQLIFSGLVAAGMTVDDPWWVVGLVLFVGTVGCTALLVTIVQRTPLRFILTGPNRTDERATLEWYPPSTGPRPPGPSASSAPAPIGRRRSLPSPAPG